MWIAGVRSTFGMATKIHLGLNTVTPNLTHATPWPRGLSREMAAAYVGIGTTFFDLKVAEGVLPKPFKLGVRSLWDIRKLDAAFDLLDESMPPLGRNPWETQ
jgi:predicted DNA-binding transcriptional regulator AlpA